MTLPGRDLPRAPVIRSTEFEGHVATLRCRLGRDQGWDVCAELDSAVVR